MADSVCGGRPRPSGPSELCRAVLRGAAVTGMVSSLSSSVLQQCAGGDTGSLRGSHWALDHLADSLTGSSRLTKAGFPIVCCWNIPQSGFGPLKIDGLGPTPAFSLRILWTRARSSSRGLQSQGLASSRCWNFHSPTDTCKLSPPKFKVLSSSSSRAHLHVCSAEVHMDSCLWTLRSTSCSEPLSREEPG